jgi:hypothetical protein
MRKCKVTGKMPSENNSELYQKEISDLRSWWDRYASFQGAYVENLRNLALIIKVKLHPIERLRLLINQPL